MAKGKDYHKGYRAGKRARDPVDEEKLRLEREQDRYDKFFCAALQGLFATNSDWSHNDLPVDNVERYVDVAIFTADDAMRKIGDRSL